jgi:DNA-binding HxlR family transcriptional regulator
MGVPEVVMDSLDGVTWPEIMRRLEVLRRQWDLACIENMAEVPGIRAGVLMRRVNAQSPGRRLTWKVLAERLDWLAAEGYVTRRETEDGRGTCYWLRPRGWHALSAARVMAAWHDEHGESCLVGPVPKLDSVGNLDRSGLADGSP